MLANRDWFLVTDETGVGMALGDPHQDANGWFPNGETATAAASTACGNDPSTMLYVVHCSRTVVSTVTGSMQVVVTPV